MYYVAFYTVLSGPVPLLLFNISTMVFWLFKLSAFLCNQSCKTSKSLLLPRFSHYIAVQRLFYTPPPPHSWLCNWVWEVVSNFYKSAILYMEVWNPVKANTHLSSTKLAYHSRKLLARIWQMINVLTIVKSFALQIEKRWMPSIVEHEKLVKDTKRRDSESSIFYDVVHL